MIGALVAGITGSGGASLSSYESIATVTGNASSSVLELTSIPGTFKHLQLRFMLRANTGGGTTAGTGVLKFNGSNGTAYHYLEGDGASATASGATGIMNMPYGIASSSATAHIMVVGIVDILDYASTTKNKTARAFYGMDRNGSGTVEVWSGFRNNTAALTSVSITGDYAFTTSSTIALYGIKEA